MFKFGLRPVYGYDLIDAVCSTVRYEVMKLCTEWVSKEQQELVLGGPELI